MREADLKCPQGCQDKTGCVGFGFYRAKVALPQVALPRLCSYKKRSHGCAFSQLSCELLGVE